MYWKCNGSEYTILIDFYGILPFQYTEIRQLLAQIAANLETMNRMAQTVNLRTFNGKNLNLKLWILPLHHGLNPIRTENEMDELHNKNLRLGNQLMTRFNDFKANLPAENDYSLEARMKRTLFYGLHQTFINLWHKNELFLQNYETKVKKNLRLHTKISKCDTKWTSLIKCFATITLFCLRTSLQSTF